VSRAVAAPAVAALVVVTMLLLIPAAAGNTPNPSSVTVAGSLQSELGCPGDWQPDCAATHLAYDANDDVWQGTWTVPAGSWEFKAALNDSWDENYGLDATRNGPNIPLSLAAPAAVKFYYDHKTHWITDNQSSVIATAPGSYQSELGCSGDWDPSCLRSWLEDPDGDGIYTFETTALPQGSYETKAAIGESWDENYGQGGVRNGANIPFTVPFDGAKMVFRYDATSHVLTISTTHAQDNNVEYVGLRFDSRDTLYRTPAGAAPAGTPVTLRFRTFHNDVTGVKARVYDTNTGTQQFLAMQRVASDVSCYQAALADDSCDYWQAMLPDVTPDVLWYRFIVNDGTATAYYADDTKALDGGVGVVTSTPVDNSYALTVYDPSFTVPAWAKHAVIYQIFPDRFRNADKSNDPPTGTALYDLQSVLKPWNAKPEGYCRSYDTPCSEGPRGRDFFGGDLKGVRQKLDYIHSAGFNTIYLNPIFWARSNHRYDTADYLEVDPYLGDLNQFKLVVQQAHELGMHIILDGVFNHVSSDSTFFDRYHHWPTLGACESTASPYRDWFHFTSTPGPCAPGVGYDGWFGFDTLPVLNKSLPAVQDYFLTGADSVTKHWLTAGSDGWRLDVMGDPSFPTGYWQQFRQVVKATDPEALIVGELWQKDTTLLQLLRGDAADTTMNYRLRDLVNGFLSPNAVWDDKGFADSGHPLTPSQVAQRLLSVQEDYAPPAYSSLMNLIDSHDTARALWLLTPGPNDPAAKELNAGAVAEGKQRLRLASLLQYTIPGAPTVYYGDEVGVTGGDDPDNRRTYPWSDTGGKPDKQLLSYYTALGQLRHRLAPLSDGDFRVLLADDGAGVLAYGRKDGGQAVLVVFNRSDTPHAVSVPVGGYLPDGTTMAPAFGGDAGATVSGGVAAVTIPALSGVVLATGTVDLTPPAAPTGLHATASTGAVSLGWNPVADAAGYNVYRSSVSGGGYLKVNGAPVTGTSFDDTGLANGVVEYYVVKAVDTAGNESDASNEVSATPHLAIGWANIQWPPSLTHTISTTTRTDNVYGQVWIDGVTSAPGPAPTLQAQLGWGPDGSNPAGNTAWQWVDATFNGDSGSNDEFVASLLPDRTGSFDYAYRYSTTGGADWVYADLDGTGNGYDPSEAGDLTVNPSGDTTPPATPSGLHVVSAGPGAIELGWDAVTGDPTEYGYEVARGSSSGGPFTTLSLLTSTTFTDTQVDQGATYYYVVRAVDTSFNRSPDSAPLAAVAALREVAVTFDVTVPAGTPTGASVYIAGTLDLLDPPAPAWDPGATVLTKIDATHWTITLHGLEGVDLQYKYTLGSWDYVEKGAACEELANRELTLAYDSGGTQTVNDIVLNWRNVPPC
jgi:glycosidase